MVKEYWEFLEDEENKFLEGYSGPFWTHPCGRGVKINVDASVKGGKVFGGFVVRDAAGVTLHLQSKAMLCSSVLEAEVEALEWATAIAMEENCNQIEWSVDAKNAVEFISSDRSGGWG